VSLSGVCPRFTRSPKDPYLPLADPKVARLCHSRRREQRTKRRAPVSNGLRWLMVTVRPAYMAHLRRPLLVLGTLCPPFEYLDDSLRKLLSESSSCEAVSSMALASSTNSGCWSPTRRIALSGCMHL
jgi:hypothetical protein